MQARRSAYPIGLRSSEKTPLLRKYETLEDAGYSEKISITFDMNRLQAIPNPGQADSPGRVLVSMNPIRPPVSPQSSHVYYHPILSSESILASERLSLINAAPDISFAGAWMGYGFHEDGCTAGLQVAKKIKGEHESLVSVKYGNQLPECVPRVSIMDRIARMAIAAIQSLVARTE